MQRVVTTKDKVVRIVVRLSGLTLLSLAAAACSSQPPPPPPPPPPPVEVPGWVLEIPARAGKICASGGVDPTFYRQDGLVYAAEAARNELARSIQVHISSIMYDTSTQRGGNVEQYIVSEVVTAVNEGVLAGAEIISYWYDETGAVSGPRMTYALACMDTNQSVSDLARKLEEAYPDDEHQDQIAAVKDRARVAFDELERLEEKRAAERAGLRGNPSPAAPDPAPAMPEPDSGDQP